VVQTPERLSLRTLVALCDILDCGPSDLIEPEVEAAKPRAKATGTGGRAATGARTKIPRSAEIKLK